MATKKKNSVFDEDNDGSEIRVHQNPNKEVMEENNVSNTPLPTQETNVVPPTQNVVNNVAPTAEEINVVYNPLDGEVKKRDYASGNTNEPVVERVPEPPINNIPPPPPPPPPPPSNTPPQQNPYEKPLNPDMAFVPPKDQKMFSTMLVDAILSGYKQFWGFAADYVSVTDEQIVDWVMNDKISLDITLPINENGGEATLREVYNIYNTQAKEALIVTDEFIVSVRESMIREFARRGWGISDMQNIIQAFVRDAGAKGIAVYQLKATINQFTKGIMKNHAELVKLREELTKVKEKVEASEPTVIKKKARTETSSDNLSREVPREQTQKDTMKGAAEFITKYEIIPNQEPPVQEVTQTKRSVFETEEVIAEETKNVEPEIREVPEYDGHEEIQAKPKEEDFLDNDAKTNE